MGGFRERKRNTNWAKKEKNLPTEHFKGTKEEGKLRKKEREKDEKLRMSSLSYISSA